MGTTSSAEVLAAHVASDSESESVKAYLVVWLQQTGGMSMSVRERADVWGEGGFG